MTTIQLYANLLVTNGYSVETIIGDNMSKWWCCSADYGKHDPTCKNYKEDQKETNKLVNALDKSKVGRFGFNKSTIIIDNKEDVCITVYDTNNRLDEFDEQLTFRPEELIEFCREIIRISEK